MMSDEKRAERLLKKAATLRRNNVIRDDVCDSAIQSLPLTKTRRKSLESDIRKAGKIKEAMEMESEAARLLGKPDPHSQACRVITEAERAAALISEADVIEERAALMEEANSELGLPIFIDAMRMRRRAVILRCQAGGEPPLDGALPLSPAEFAATLEEQAHFDEMRGLTRLAADKRDAARLIKSGEFTSPHLLSDERKARLNRVSGRAS